MARVTVEDCVKLIPNRFELVMLAAQRGRNIGAGAPLTLDRDNDKNAVVALREIAEAKVDLSELENGLIRGLQNVIEADEPEGDEIDLLPVSEEIGAETDEARIGEEVREDDLRLEDDGGVEIADASENPAFAEADAGAAEEAGSDEASEDTLVSMEGDEEPDVI